MSLNYVFVFSMLLLFLVCFNIYFYIILSVSDNKSISLSAPLIDGHLTSSVFREIYEHLNYLPIHYKSKNPKIIRIQQKLLENFNYTNNPGSGNFNNWEGHFPIENGEIGELLQLLHSSKITLVDNATKGTQLKLLFLLENKLQVYFKPKRYSLTEIIKGDIYAGYDRHNSEVFGFYLGAVLNFTWIPPSVIRKVNVEKDIVPLATLGLKKTMVRKASGAACIFGKCFYCKVNETVCPDENGELEGAAIFLINKQFRIYKSPWRRSYTTKKMDWQTDKDYCKKIVGTLSTKRLLNLIDVSIFDFLIQNGDRHRYEVYKDLIVILDNGKGLGNPRVDELDILAPLFQCCILNIKTWGQLEMLSGGSLTATMKLLASLNKSQLATEEHFKAVERRLLKVYATVQYCIGKHGTGKVFKYGY